MKSLPFLFGVSVLLNLALAGVFLCGPTPSATDSPSVPAARPLARAAPMPQAVAGDSPAPVPAQSAATLALGSPEVRAADFSALAARLRAEGYPPEVVRRVVANLIAQHFAERSYATIRPKHNPVEYWKSPVIFATSEESTARRQLEREQTAFAREVFGPDVELSEDRAARLYHGISSPTVAKMKKIYADYRDLEDKIRDQAAPRENIGPKLTMLEKEKRADLERVMSPEELHTFDLRNGAASARLRNHFGAFQPTEAEFLALHPIMKAQAEAEAGQPAPRLTREERLAQRDALDAEARRVLGEARFAEFLKTRNNP